MLYCECPCVCCDTQVFLLPDGATGEGIRCPSCGRPLRATVLRPFGEAEWLATDAPIFLAQFDTVRKASARKRRLFACGCCRLVWDLLADKRSRAAVEMAERAAEGVAGRRELAAAFADAEAAATESAAYHRANIPLVVEATQEEPIPAAVVRCLVRGSLRRQSGENSARASDVAALLRCIFGNPFHPVTLNPDLRTWRGGLLPAAARRMLDARDYSAMPILADMLEEAGCADAAVLAHCRGPGPHAAGCFVLDGLLSLG